MTTDDTAPDADDVAAAYLDGEATDVERARVEADPVLLERVEQFRRVGSAVGAGSLSIDDDVRDRMIERALAAGRADDAADGGLSEGMATPPVQLEERRRRRQAPGGGVRLPPPGLVAAAVALLLFIGAGLLITADDRDSERAVTGAESNTAEDSGAEGLESADSRESAVPEDETAAGQPFADLGEFADEDALRAAVVAEPAPSASLRSDGDAAGDTPSAEAPQDPHAAAGEDASPVERCEVVITNIDPVLGELLQVREASIAGEPVWVFTHANRDGPAGVTDTVVEQRSCRIVFAVAR